MAKLHELLAVIQDRAGAAGSILQETGVTFTKRADHFKGQTRTVSFFDEERSAENASETKEFVTSVDDKLDHTFKALGKYWNSLLQLEATNATAKADLIVDGMTISKDVPATFLLGMETRLKELRNVLLTIPTLAPEIAWSEDETAGKGVFVSAPQVNFKGEKQLRHTVVYEATKEHPAQVEKWTEDRPVARIETTHRSTMYSPARKAVMVGRVDKLLSAVKRARQRANGVEVDTRRIATEMFDYIRGA